MRLALWLLGLFAVASAIALFAGNNQGVVSVFWPPYRIDVSANLALLALAGFFVLLYLAVRGLSLFVSLPAQARRWRTRRQQVAAFGAFVDALAQLQAGRFSRARKMAEHAITLQNATVGAEEQPSHAAPLRMLAHLLAAESLQFLQDRGARDAHLNALLALRANRADATVQAALEGAQIRAARWALDDRDAALALRRLDELPAGVSRRVLALRIRLKAARQSGQTSMALETTRALIRHRAFSPVTATSLVRSLALELIGSAHDPTQLKKVWDSLQPVERSAPELAVLLARRLCLLGGDRALALAWLMPAWQQMADSPQALDSQVRFKLVRALEDAMDSAAPDWLARIEAAQLAFPTDPGFSYLAGVTCMKRQLWGKAQQLLARAAPQLQDLELRRRAWVALAELALQRGDSEAAAQAWRQAASLPVSGLL